VWPPLASLGLLLFGLRQHPDGSGSHRVGVRSGCSWDRKSSLEKPSPYARVPNELCGFVAVHRLSLRAADDPNLSSAGEVKACRNSRTVFIAGVDACLRSRTSLDCFFVSLGSSSPRFSRSRANSVATSPAPTLKGSVNKRWSGLPWQMGRPFVHDLFDIGDQVVTGGGEPTADGD
jgi:hypothetical protein